MISKKFLFESLILLSPLALFFLWSPQSESQVSAFAPVARFIQQASKEISRPIYSVFKKEEPLKITFVNPAKKPIDWDLQEIGIDPKELEPLLDNKQPEKLVYFRGNRFVQLQPKTKDDSAQGTIFISNQEAIDLVKNERYQDMLAKSGGRGSAGPDSVETVKKERHEDMQAKLNGTNIQGQDLAQQDYELEKFTPGLRDDRVTVIDTPANASEAIYGPDFNLSGKELSDSNRATVLSLGHNGEVVLNIKGQGSIVDEDGFDFALYENPFRIAGVESKYYQELAQVGVAEVDQPDKYKWFECDPNNGVLKGCMGVVPTIDGGDQFDLAQVGIKKAQFIKIKDIGVNFDNKGSGTEGADLDAGSLSHGIVVK